MKKHKHAELMALYARDAAETETPWEMWECRYKAEWEPCDCEIGFFTTCDYRRKPDDLSEAVTLATAIHDRCYPEATDWKPLDTVSGVLSQISNMVAGLFDHITELQAWKRSAIECSPPWQEIGRALDLPIGTDVPPEILPGILSLREKVMELERTIKTQTAVHASLGVRAKELQGLRELAQEHNDARERAFRDANWQTEVRSAAKKSWKWAAMDSNGRWFVYETRPEKGDGMWYPTDDEELAHRFECSAKPNWHGSLIEL